MLGSVLEFYEECSEHTSSSSDWDYSEISNYVSTNIFNTNNKAKKKLRALLNKLRKPKKKQTSKSEKTQLVKRILCRWWYVFKQWPPEDYDYSSKLAELGLSEPKEVPGYPGLFMDSKEVIYDLRPYETAPTYNNLVRLEKSQLLGLLCSALKAQLLELQSQPYFDSCLAYDLQTQIEDLSINI